MASTKTITTQKIIDIVKEKWQLFGVTAFIIFILQLLSSKVLLSVFLGLVVTALIPSDAVKKVVKKVTTKTTGD